jgi:hypothetical protein
VDLYAAAPAAAAVVSTNTNLKLAKRRVIITATNTKNALEREDHPVRRHRDHDLMPRSSFPASAAAQLKRRTGLVPTVLVDVQLRDGTIYYFASAPGTIR